MPMHQEPSITDEEVEERLPLAGERGRLWRAGTAKFFLDGVLDSGTAWLVDPGPGGANAHPFWPDVGRYAAAGPPLHATPASARSRTRSATARCAARSTPTPPPDRRGAGCTGSSTSRRCSTRTCRASRRSGVAASMQPLHMEGLDDPATPSSWVDGLSAGRYERGFRAGDLARAGALIPLGSDWFVADFDPRVGLAWAQLRRKPGRPDLVPYLPAQALDAETALRGYTTAAARVAGDEDVYGRLRPGLRADITVLGGDPLDDRAGRAAGRPRAVHGGRRRRRVRRLTLGNRLQPHLSARARVVNRETETTRTPRRTGATQRERSEQA